MVTRPGRSVTTSRWGRRIGTSCWGFEHLPVRCVQSNDWDVSERVECGMDGYSPLHALVLSVHGGMLGSHFESVDRVACRVTHPWTEDHGPPAACQPHPPRTGSLPGKGWPHHQPVRGRPVRPPPALISLKNRSRGNQAGLTSARRRNATHRVSRRRILTSGKATGWTRSWYLVVDSPLFGRTTRRERAQMSEPTNGGRQQPDPDPKRDPDRVQDEASDETPEPDFSDPTAPIWADPTAPIPAPPTPPGAASSPSDEPPAGPFAPQ